MLIALAYIAAVVAANFTVATFGPAVTPINAFVFIGLDLTLRNLLGVKWPPLQMLALIGIAGLVSYGLNPASGAMALASVCAFVGAAIRYRP
jgi:queuosine precursor transporter